MAQWIRPDWVRPDFNQFRFSPQSRALVIYAFWSTHISTQQPWLRSFFPLLTTCGGSPAQTYPESCSHDRIPRFSLKVKKSVLWTFIRCILKLVLKTEYNFQEIFFSCVINSKKTHELMSSKIIARTLFLMSSIFQELMNTWRSPEFQELLFSWVLSSKNFFSFDFIISFRLFSCF